MAAPREQEPTEGLIYVNWARTMGSPYDLILDLGFRTEYAPPPTFPIRAVMTWEQAKGLAALLQSAVDDYEKEVGEIRNYGEEVVPAEAEEEDSEQVSGGDES